MRPGSDTKGGKRPFAALQLEYMEAAKQTFDLTRFAMKGDESLPLSICD